MPRKMVIVVVSIILAILALSFFSVGYTGEALVIYEEWKPAGGYDYDNMVCSRLMITQGDFYLFSILCLIGMCFLAIYTAFTSRKE